MSSGVIDLRPRKSGRKPVAGQRPLFSQRPPARGGRPLPLRTRRRRARLAYLLGALALVGVVAYVVHVVSYLPVLNIQSVSVVGTQNVPSALLHDYVLTILDDGSSHYLSRTNIMLYPRSLIARDVAHDFPRIASADVSRAGLFSTELVVHVTERRVFALWCRSGNGSVATQCYDMDQSGFVYAEAPTSATSTEYEFFGGLSSTTPPIGQTFVRAYLPSLLNILNALGQAGYAATGASVENDTDVSVPLARGFIVKASFGENPGTLIKNMQLVLGSDPLRTKLSELEYVDLRFGDRVYYKMKGETAATTTSQ